jgi:hypothetical protein
VYENKLNSEYKKFIFVFVNHICEEERFSIKDEEETLSRISFCLEEVKFWQSRNNPSRYSESLKSTLGWLFLKYQNKF